jgi:hypothetical protein
MIAICVQVLDNKYITIGKKYEILKVNVNSLGRERYKIINNVGNHESYNHVCFKLLSDIRDEKLQQLVI